MCKQRKPLLKTPIPLFFMAMYNLTKHKVNGVNPTKREAEIISHLLSFTDESETELTEIFEMLVVLIKKHKCNEVLIDKIPHSKTFEKVLETHGIHPLYVVK